MTEEEYMIVTNKVRANDAIELLRSLSLDGPVQRSLLATARKALSDLVDELSTSMKPFEE